MIFIVGKRIQHVVYGKGTIVFVADSVARCFSSNLRHSTQKNVAVKFDNGGPMGWGECGKHPRPQHHDIEELKELAA